MVHRVWNKTQRQSNEVMERKIKISEYKTLVKQLENCIGIKTKNKQILHHEPSLMSHYLRKIDRISQQI